MQVASWTAAHCDIQSADPSRNPGPDVFATIEPGNFGINASVHAATVRVRPAFAGEGRYFVRVPDGELTPLFGLAANVRA